MSEERKVYGFEITIFLSGDSESVIQFDCNDENEVRNKWIPFGKFISGQLPLENMADYEDYGMFELKWQGPYCTHYLNPSHVSRLTITEIDDKYKEYRKKRQGVF